MPVFLITFSIIVHLILNRDQVANSFIHLDLLVGKVIQQLPRLLGRQQALLVHPPILYPYQSKTWRFVDIVRTTTELEKDLSAVSTQMLLDKTRAVIIST